MNIGLIPVIPIEGESFRYYVGDSEYLVDLMANNGEGQCDCDDWKNRKRRCKHIAAARRWEGDIILTKILAAAIAVMKHMENEAANSDRSGDN